MQEFNNRSPLLETIITWAIISLIAYTALGFLWGTGTHPLDRLLTNWRVDSNVDPIDRIRASLTMLGGIGGIGYLVIKFRERSSLERSEGEDRLAQAVEQLGSDSPQVRIAGAYAVANVADTYGGAYHQRAVDILCGYLRTYRIGTVGSGSPHTPSASTDIQHPSNIDGPVESTILSILSARLRSKRRGQGPWSPCYIDLHGAVLTENVDFSDTHIRIAYFDDVHFKGRVWFSRAHFKDKARFEGVKFDMEHYFDDVDFAGGVSGIDLSDVK